MASSKAGFQQKDNGALVVFDQITTNEVYRAGTAENNLGGLDLDPFTPLLPANNLSDLASDDTAIANLIDGATTRVPVPTDPLPFRDVGTGGGKATVLSLRTEVVSADAAVITGIGSDSTDGPWKQEYSKDFTTTGSGAETLIDIPIPNNSQMQVRVELIAVASLFADRGVSYAAIVRAENAAGTCAVGTSAVFANEAGGFPAPNLDVTYIISGTNLRIRVDDNAGNVLQIGAFITRIWRTTSA